jgi:hypothetical protein
MVVLGSRPLERRFSLNRTWLLVVLALGVVCLAPPPVRAAEGEIGFRGWGPRVGISDDPDQVVGGVHFDLGEFARNVRWQPSFDAGFGDDVLTLTANFMVAYYFPVDGNVKPYAGGQLTAAYFDFDEDAGDDSETEIGVAAVGGMETRIGKGQTRFLAEVQIAFGDDLPDIKLLAGWTF